MIFLGHVLGEDEQIDLSFTPSGWSTPYAFRISRGTAQWRGSATPHPQLNNVSALQSRVITHNANMDDLIDASIVTTATELGEPADAGDIAAIVNNFTAHPAQTQRDEGIVCAGWLTVLFRYDYGDIPATGATPNQLRGIRYDYDALVATSANCMIYKGNPIVQTGKMDNKGGYTDQVHCEQLLVKQLTTWLDWVAEHFDDARMDTSSPKQLKRLSMKPQLDTRFRRAKLSAQAVIRYKHSGSAQPCNACKGTIATANENWAGLLTIEPPVQN